MMAKKSFKISLKNYFSKSPAWWMMTLADVRTDEVEAEINAFAEALRDEKFSDEDFVTKLI